MKSPVICRAARTVQLPDQLTDRLYGRFRKVPDDAGFYCIGQTRFHKQRFIHRLFRDDVTVLQFFQTFPAENSRGSLVDAMILFTAARNLCPGGIAAGSFPRNHLILFFITF